MYIVCGTAVYDNNQIRKFIINSKKKKLKILITIQIYF